MVRRSLYLKIISLMLLTAAIPFLISNLITYYSSSQALQKNIIQTNISVMQQGMERTISYFDELETLSLQWYYDSSLFQILKGNSLDYVQTSYLESKMLSLLYSREELQGVTFSSAKDGKKYIKNRESSGHKYIVEQERIDEKMKDRFLLFETASLNGSSVLYLHRKLVDMPSGDVLGYLSFSFSTEEIRVIQDQLFDESNEQIFLFIDQAQAPALLYPTVESAAYTLGSESFLPLLPNENPSGNIDMKIGKTPGIGIYHHRLEEKMNFTMLKFIPKQHVTQNARQALNVVLIVQLITLVFIIMLALTVSYSIISPIRRLISNMSRIEKGIFKIDQFKEREDEIGILEKRFQIMVHALSDLILKQYRNRVELTTAQLKMLQAQINPHFLYNILQTIGTFALQKGVPQIQERIVELGAILRYSMNMQEENVAFEQEVLHIQDYLSLQKSRFQERLDYDIDCSSDTRNIKIPKMIIQPLVENSIVHGIEEGKGTGAISVTSRICGKFLVLNIKDNGKGMDASLIDLIYRQYENYHIYDEKSGIGLMNVLYRLYLAFGSEFQWRITSEPYVATLVELRIPLE
ncbi:HAMP domain-containing protein [Paenibacillaceae bacterium]|nr:HAMP domain-containing protein [Paenibacillaceae bacterium]